MDNNNKNSRLKPIFKNGRFFNPHENHRNNLYEKITLIYSLFHEILIFFNSLINFKKRNPINNEQWIEQTKSIKDCNLNSSTITWIGHATFLIKIFDNANSKFVNILTDPIFFNVTIFFQRIFPPGIKPESLPKIDYVLISHNHWDHMDSKSLFLLKKLYPDITFLVPLGDKKWFDKKGFLNSFEFNWWESFAPSTQSPLLGQAAAFNSEQSKASIKFTFLPAHHWSQHGLFDGNKSLWGSWIIENNYQTIYFAGDTAYSNHFLNIANEFPNIDIALMPIGPCEPREKMCHSHVSAQEAGQAFLDLNAKYFIPMHWGTFHFGTDLFETPIIRLKKWWKQNENNLDSKTLNILKIGQSIVLDQRIQLSYTDQIKESQI